MVLQVGAVPVKQGYKRSKQNRINVYVAYSLLIAGIVPCPTFNFLQIFTLENIYKFKLALFIHEIKSDPTNIPVMFSGALTQASEIHSYNTTFATNFNIYRSSISNNNYYGATTFSFAAQNSGKPFPQN